MHTKDFLVDNCSNWKAVEAVCERFPKFDVVASFALVIKSINTVDGGTFMVSTENEKIVRVFDFVSKEKADSFKALLSSVDVITKEKVISFRRKVPILKKTKQIIVLAMDITLKGERISETHKNGRKEIDTANFDGSFQFEQNRLADKYLTRLHAKTANLAFLKRNISARAVSSHLQKALNDGVDVDVHDRRCEEPLSPSSLFCGHQNAQRCVTSQPIGIL